MPSHLKLRFHNSHDVRLEEHEDAPLTPDSVQIKMAYCGICGTDLHEYHEAVTMLPTKENPHPGNGVTLPIDWGHEMSGVIIAVGEECKDKFKVGDNVAVRPNVGCQKCNSCKNGHPHVCKKAVWYGGHTNDTGAGLSQVALIKGSNAYKLPDNIPLDIGALVEPLAVAWHAVRMSGIKKGDIAYVVGGGPIGSFLLRSLKAREVGYIFCSEPATLRAQGAKKAGANEVLNPLTTDVPKAILAKYPEGVDVSFDAAGVTSGASMNSCIWSTKSRGKIMSVAMYANNPGIDLSIANWHEITIQGIMAYEHQDYVEVIEALSQGRIDCDGVITSKIALEDIVEKGLDELKMNKDKHIKIMVEHK